MLAKNEWAPAPTGVMHELSGYLLSFLLMRVARAYFPSTEMYDSIT